MNVGERRFSADKLNVDFPSSGSCLDNEKPVTEQ